MCVRLSWRERKPECLFLFPFFFLCSLLAGTQPFRVGVPNSADGASARASIRRSMSGRQEETRYAALCHRRNKVREVAAVELAARHAGTFKRTMCCLLPVPRSPVSARLHLYSGRPPLSRRTWIFCCYGYSLTRTRAVTRPPLCRPLCVALIDVVKQALSHPRSVLSCLLKYMRWQDSAHMVVPGEIPALGAKGNFR